MMSTIIYGNNLPGEEKCVCPTEPSDCSDSNSVGERSSPKQTLSCL